MSILLPRKKKKSHILNTFSINKKTIIPANILKKRARKLLLVLVISTLVITAKKKTGKNGKYLGINFT